MEGMVGTQDGDGFDCHPHSVAIFFHMFIDSGDSVDTNWGYSSANVHIALYEVRYGTISRTTSRGSVVSTLSSTRCGTVGLAGSGTRESIYIGANRRNEPPEVLSTLGDWPLVVYQIGLYSHWGRITSTGGNHIEYYSDP